VDSSVEVSVATDTSTAENDVGGNRAAATHWLRIETENEMGESLPLVPPCSPHLLLQVCFSPNVRHQLSKIPPMGGRRGDNRP
jgi:hypothetical protein